MDAPRPDAALPPGHQGPPPSALQPPAGSSWQAPGSGRPSSWRAARTETRRRSFWLACLVVILVPVLLVLAVLVFAGKEVGAIVSFPGETGGQITTANIRTIAGRTRWELFAAPGLDLADGARLACDVVRPVFVRRGILNPEFYVLNRAGDVISSWQTPCGAPKATGPLA